MKTDKPEQPTTGTGAREWLENNGPKFDGDESPRVLCYTNKEIAMMLDSYSSSLRDEIDRLTRERDEAIHRGCVLAEANVRHFNTAMENYDEAELQKSRAESAESALSTYKELVGELAKLDKDKYQRDYALDFPVYDLIRRARELETKQ